MKNLSFRQGIKKYRIGIIFLVLILTQILLFRTYAMRNAAGNILVNEEQNRYLYCCYHIYELILSGKYLNMVSYIFNNLNCSFFGMMGVCVLFLIGDNPIYLTWINICAYLVTESVGFVLISKVAKKRNLGWLFVGQFMMANSAFFDRGGLLDFRPDFIISCLYLCWISILVVYAHTQSRTCGYISAVLMGLATLFSMNSLVYLAIPFILFEICKIALDKGKGLRKEAAFLIKYIIIFLVFGGWCLFVEIGSFILGKHTLHSQEALLNAHAGFSGNFWNSLSFQVASLVNHHLGNALSIFVLTALMVFGGLIVVGLICHRVNIKKGEILAIWGILCANVVPLLILSIGKNYSPALVGIITGGIILLTSYVISLAYSYGILRKSYNWLIIGVTILGLGNFLIHITA